MSFDLTDEERKEWDLKRRCPKKVPELGDQMLPKELRAQKQTVPRVHGPMTHSNNTDDIIRRSRRVNWLINNNQGDGGIRFYPPTQSSTKIYTENVQEQKVIDERSAQAKFNTKPVTEPVTGRQTKQKDFVILLGFCVIFIIIGTVVFNTNNIT